MTPTLSSRTADLHRLLRHFFTPFPLLSLFTQNIRSLRYYLIHLFGKLVLTG